MKIAVLTFAFVLLISSESFAYSNIPAQKHISPACENLIYSKFNIEPFIEYLQGIQKSKTLAVRSLDDWISVLKNSYSSEKTVKNFVQKELSGMISLRNKFLAGKIASVNDAVFYIHNNYYLRRACGASMAKRKLSGSLRG